MTNDHSLRRIFSSSSSGKYPTIGKFLPQTSSQQTVFPDPEIKENDDKSLDLLDQLVTQTLANQGDSLQSASDASTQVSSRAKETLLNQVQLNTENPLPEEIIKPPETIATIKSAESAPSPEVAELSKELQEVSKETKEQREQAMIKEKQQEINNLAALSTTPVAVSDKPVVVLPITAKSKEEAKFKGTKYSVRWLLEWCEKIAKAFSGAVVYKEEIEDV